MIPADHPPIPPARVGVLLINLGTPDEPTPEAVKRYLQEFLSDRRVVELPRLIWQPILRAFVLRSRPAKSAKLYASVWDKELDDSPLRAITRAQSNALQGAFGPGGAGGVGDAVWEAGDRSRTGAVAGGGVFAGADRALVSAILRGDDRDRERCRVRGAGEAALAARDPDDAALL